jgi:PAS domain S-box-containing protein
MTGTIRVLCVDDESTLLDISTLFLEKSGDFRVKTALSAPEAMQLLDQEKFDAIISDYQMPGMDGIQFLVEVRKRFGPIPFILFTGRGREEVVIQTINNGADFYVQKGGEIKSQFVDLSHKVRQAVRRSAAERALHENEIRYRTLFQNASDIIRILDKNNIIVYDSPSSEKILGYPEMSLVGKNPLDYVYPDDHDRVMSCMSQIHEGEKTNVVTEFRIRKENGEYIWVESVIVNLFGVEGVDGIVVTTRPINERKQIEEILRKSEADLRRAEEIGRFGSWEVRLDENSVNASQGARSLYGLTGAHLTLEEIQQIPLPEYRSVLNTALRDLIAGKSPYNVEFKIRNPSDGTVLDIHSIAEYDRGRNIVFGVFHDITGRKQAEERLQKQKAELNAVNEQLKAAKEELHRQYDTLQKSENTTRRSEEKFRYLVEYALDGILILDVKGIIRFANNAAAHLTETDDANILIGRKVMDFIASESRLDVTRDSVQVFEENNGHLTHYNMISAKGKKINVEGVGKSVMFEGNTAVLVALRDVTERKLAEEALRDANSKLSLVTNITRHDINNQLLALNAYVELLHEKMPDSSLENYFLGIKQASDRISSMIQFTKKYNTAGESTPRWQNIRRIVDAAANQVNLRKIPEINDLPAGIEVYADPLIIKVFYNLMENAVRYGGKITVIRFFIEEIDGSPIVVCEDDGDGIPAEDKERIFDWGFGKNTGLGLALSREILGITGIRIRETGIPGKGARFEMAVPGSSFRK